MLLTLDANAQDYEILRLKDGTEITGTIEKLQNGGVRITDLNGDIFIFSADEILLITNQELKEKEEKKQKYSERKQKGYMGILELGAGYGYDFVSVGMINGYKCSQYFYLGAGFEIGYYSAQVYAHLRYTILGDKFKVSPYLALNVGTELLADMDVFPEVHAGIKIKGPKKGDFWVAFTSAYYTFNAFPGFGVRAGWSF